MKITPREKGELAFPSLYYPWGKKGTTRSLDRERSSFFNINCHVRRAKKWNYANYSSSTRSFQGHVISSTTPSQQNLPEKQIFWGKDPLGVPGCVYFLVTRWFILTDFYTMSLHINTYFGSNFSFYRSPSCRVALHARLFHTVYVRYQKSKY